MIANNSKNPKPVRCAIYTRKSTTEGLEQEFNSLDAQRESATAYIASQRSEGWTEVETRYDDGGFTGGNLERPALKRLLADIKARRVDCVVVYKVDRLSRSLLDFTKIMETLDASGCSFVSVTQQFNTTSSMGRLTLNILLSFAQYLIQGIDQWSLFATIDVWTFMRIGAGDYPWFASGCFLGVSVGMFALAETLLERRNW